MKPAIRIALLYALFSGGYIVFSDWIVWFAVSDDPEALTQWQSLKGLGFVAMSALIIFFLVLHYVQSRDRAEKGLEEVSESFRQLFERNPIPAVVYNTETLRFMAVNQATMDEYGYQREELLRMKIVEVTPPEDRERLISHVSRVKMHSYSGQWKQLRKDGTVFDADIVSHHMVFGGEPARLVACVNVSAHRLVEQALVEACAARNEVGQAKTRFLGAISHEMRTPLNAVVGYLDLLPGEPSEVRRREFAEIALQSAERLVGLIDRLIQAASVNSGSEKREAREIGTHEFLRGITNGFFQTAVGKKIKLDLTLGKSVPARIRVDIGKLQEILQVLVGNALKFSSGGTVILSANLSSVPTHLDFTVSDEGIGIPREMRDRIFESFFQVEQDTSRRYEGAGMGLYVAKQLCDLMGAELKVKSSESGGSAFTVSLSGEIDRAGVFTAGAGHTGAAV